MVDARRAPRAGVPGPAAAPAPAPAGGFQSMMGTVLRFGVMWYMMRSFNKPSAPSTSLSANGTTIAAPGYATPVYRRGDLLDMRAYLSESPFLPADRAGARLVWVERDVPLAAPDIGAGAGAAAVGAFGVFGASPEGRRRVLRYVPSPAVAGNSSGLYLHVAFRRAASAVGAGEDATGAEDASFGKVYNLVAHLPRPKNKTGVNLLGGDAASGALGGGLKPPLKKNKDKKAAASSASSSLSPASLLGKGPREIVPFLRPGVGVAMVDHFQAYPRGGIPAPLLPHALLTSDGAGLLPWLWFDDFWQLRDGMHALNASWTGGGPALVGAAGGGGDGQGEEGGEASADADADAAAAAASSPGGVLMLPPLRGNATEALEHASAPLVALHLPDTAPASGTTSDDSNTDNIDNDDPDAPPPTEAGRAALAALRARVLSGDVPAATLRLELKPLSFWRMQIFTQMEASFKMQVGAGLSQEGESDDIKRIFLEGNPFLLAITMAVSLLHSVFDFLAFKNDIGFWRENKSLEGLSARSVLLNAFSQLVIFLYLLDNDTSMVVLLSAGAGTAIEFWKITKAFDVELRPAGSWPPLRLRDRASYHQSDTRKHDEVAMRYLSYVLLPLVAGYSIYALVYESHRSWYSWALGSLVGAVYAFGFILMCPQLYLNYKLQSVAHLPWRQMTYKFLNTIIDDLFAFVIKMPLLHRLSVFRDDVVFLVYLYQRWIYRVDPKRANEFGFSAEDLERREREAAEKQALLGAAGAAGAATAGALAAATAGEGEAAAEAAAGGASGSAAAAGVRLLKPAAAGETQEGEEEEEGEQPPGEKKDR